MVAASRQADGVQTPVRSTGTRAPPRSLIARLSLFGGNLYPSSVYVQLFLIRWGLDGALGGHTQVPDSGKTSFPDWESSPGRGGESAQYSPLDLQGAIH